MLVREVAAHIAASAGDLPSLCPRSRADRRVISEPTDPPSGLGPLQGSMSAQISRWLPRPAANSA